MKRKIVERKYLSSKYCRDGEGSVWLTLECGHIVRKKGSQEPKNYCLCEKCDK